MVGMGRWPAQSALYHKELAVDEYLEYHLDLKGLLHLWGSQDLQIQQDSSGPHQSLKWNRCLHGRCVVLDLPLSN
jgi:hypothetical protein